MSEEVVTLSVLMRFHREVFLPDVERIVSGTVGSAESRLRDEMHTLHDSLLVKFDRLETEPRSKLCGRLSRKKDAPALEWAGGWRA